MAVLTWVVRVLYRTSLASLLRFLWSIGLKIVMQLTRRWWKLCWRWLSSDPQLSAFGLLILAPLWGLYGLRRRCRSLLLVQSFHYCGLARRCIQHGCATVCTTPLNLFIVRHRRRSAFRWYSHIAFRGQTWLFSQFSGSQYTATIEILLLLEFYKRKELLEAWLVLGGIYML